MAEARSARILRAPCRVLVGPFDPLDESVYPHGGREIGSANMVMLQPLGQSYRVVHEDTGETGDVIESGQRWVASMFLRGWDDDAINLLLSRGATTGENTQHAVFSVPGQHQSGTSEIGHAVSLLFVPNDTVNVPGAICYRAIPDWTDAAEIAFQRGAELGIPLVFELLRDDDGRVLQIGRIRDLEA